MHTCDLYIYSISWLNGLLVVRACVYVCDFFRTRTFLQIIQIKDSLCKVSVMFLMCSKIFSVWLSWRHVSHLLLNLPGHHSQPTWSRSISSCENVPDYLLLYATCEKRQLSKMILLTLNSYEAMAVVIRVKYKSCDHTTAVFLGDQIRSLFF